jgi:hypothetical protein
MNNTPDNNVAKRDATKLRQIESLRENLCGELPLVVECAVNEGVSLLVFDLPVPREAVAEVDDAAVESTQAKPTDESEQLG